MKKPGKPYVKVCPDPIHIHNLLHYLHSKAALSDTFDTNISPMLGALQALRTYTSEAVKKIRETDGYRKTEMVQETALWIDVGYGYMEEDGVNKEGLPVKNMTDIFVTGTIGLDEDGFFNGGPLVKKLKVAKGSVFVPFSRQNFYDLKLKEPEVEALANCILSQELKLSREKADMMTLKGEAKLDEFERIFGRKIWQYFPQARLARYLGWAPEYLSTLISKRNKRKLKEGGEDSD